MFFPPYRELDQLTESMQERVRGFLDKAEKAGMRVIPIETWRSHERHEYLYSLGRTRPGQIVTYTQKSKHISGEAIDVAFLKNGRMTYDGDWQKLGLIGEKCGLLWGGRWPKPKKTHFEFNPYLYVE